MCAFAVDCHVLDALMLASCAFAVDCHVLDALMLTLCAFVLDCHVLDALMLTLCAFAVDCHVLDALMLTLCVFAVDCYALGASSFWVNSFQSKRMVLQERNMALVIALVRDKGSGSVREDEDGSVLGECVALCW